MSLNGHLLFESLSGLIEEIFIFNSTSKVGE